MFGEKDNLDNRFTGKPFKGIRTTKSSANKLIAPPYDVVSREQVTEIVKLNPDSFLRVSRSEVDFDERINPYSDEVYQRAANNFERLIARNMIRADEKILIMFIK